MCILSRFSFAYLQAIFHESSVEALSENIISMLGYVCSKMLSKHSARKVLTVVVVVYSTETKVGNPSGSVRS